ncbi:MAG: DUF421 domain-containing protein [Candidatus Xenobia bacterium]
MLEKLQGLFQSPGSLLLVVQHTVLIYLFLVVGMRILGRRSMAQLTIVDLWVVLLMGSAVETAMVAGNTSLPAGLVCASTLLLLNRGFATLLYRSKRLRHLLAGGPTLLVHNGVLLDNNLSRLGLRADEVLQGLRRRGYGDLSEVRYAVMESDGQINVIASRLSG